MVMIKDYFVKQGIKELRIEEFIRENFPVGDYSGVELQNTPLGMKIIIYTNKPGKIIGKGGRKIDEITDSIKKEFDMENLQIDVKGIEHPDLDAKIVAKQIKSALEKGYNYKKIGNLTLNRIMDAGALGAEIVISGKLTGSKAMMGKFTKGHLKHSGELSKRLVDEGFEEANTKPGKLGIKVKIMRESEDITGHRITAREEVGETGAKEEKPEEEKEEKAGKLEKKEKKKPKKEKKPTMDWLKKDLKKYAQDKDIKVKSSDTKKDILKKIEKKGKK